ncbi:Calcium-dependent protease [Defluviimonas aquaemixtae]|uniref:Calcium-dependent protease n=1 Tax=Albidovulum aquaemixtae TaxID=1542388 RepID=A0A2R8B2N7_9RHOB|nr:S8 family serine peptidase [Defluviimonas aquaemixtae]SPH16896.1 Calcium-dependent protease [Defluviimonas aquaemixtae]
MTRPTDPLYGNQWHLAQIGDLEMLWDYYTGNGVEVVVYDDGVEGTHEDLNDNFSPAGSFSFGGTVYGSSPMSDADGHGTAVAGLIAAEANNGLGGTGVAWGATIAALNYLEDVQTGGLSASLAAIAHAANFDVMNNSWGYGPYYQSWLSLAVPGSEGNQFEAQYAAISANGRGGLGTIIVNAAGNEALNANGESTTASRHVIAVGATDRYGNTTSYSNWGANLLVVAPDAAYTTDRTGAAGYNAPGANENPPDSLGNINYTSIFGGTSAAAPLVSGVVALMLEANPALGWRDVHNILALSASHTGSALGSGQGGFEVQGWQIANSGNWNGGGQGFSLDYGFGMVDADAAVGMAEVWLDMFGAAQTSANEATASGSFAGAIGIPDLGTAQAQANVAQNIDVETVMVTLSMTHSYSADLVVTLIAPDGSEFTVMMHEGGATLMDGGLSWTFGVEGARGLTSQGTWLLRVQDLAAGDVGTITGFSVDIYGSTQQGYDVHTFTDDFLSYRAQDASRGTIAATSANDWLNLAGVSGDISLAMTAAAPLYVGGQYWGNLTGPIDFLNISTGSGNDTIHSSSGTKRINLGFGNDTLTVGDAVGTFSGGGGIDLINYYYSPQGVSVDLLTNATSGGWAANDTINGFERVYGSNVGNDSLNGTNGTNLIRGYGGNDVVFDRGGNDTVDLGDGNDAIISGGGADTYIGGAGIDTLSYYFSANSVTVDLLSNAVAGAWAGDDTISGFERVYGSNVGNDVLRGTEGSNIIRGYGGNDIVFARNGDDLVDLGDGNDTVVVGIGSDTLVGGAGIDNINYYYSSSGVRVDLLHNTVSAGYAAGDAISGFERVYGSNTGNDTLRGSNDDNFIRGYGGNDIVFDRGGDDIVQLGTGNDIVVAGDGVDIYDGGSGGGDEVSYYYSASGVRIDLRTNSSSGGWAGDDTISGFERVSGSNTGNDTIIGSTVNNVLRGNGGNDILNGLEGNDLIDGGTGNDILVGSSGADSFVFRGGHRADRIADFSSSDGDILLLDDTLWAGTLTASQIVSTFANVIGGNLVFDFGGGDVLTLDDLTVTAGLESQITII